MLQPKGKVAVGEAGVDNLNLSLNFRGCAVSVGVDVQLELSGRDHVGIEELD